MSNNIYPRQCTVWKCVALLGWQWPVQTCLFHIIFCHCSGLRKISLKTATFHVMNWSEKFLWKFSKKVIIHRKQNNNYLMWLLHHNMQLSFFSIKKQKIYNLFRFCQHVKSKTIKIKNFKQRPKVAHILEVVPNKFWNWSTTMSEHPFNSNGLKHRNFLVILHLNLRITYY